MPARYRSVSIQQPKDPKRFGDMLTALLKKKRFREKGKYLALSDAWHKVAADAIGEENAGRTRVSGFRHGRVTVDVECPVLLQELGGFLRTGLLALLRESRGGEDVVDLRFRMRGD